MVHPQRVNRRSSTLGKSFGRDKQRRHRQLGLGLETLEPRAMLAADVVISEVMYNVAGNDDGKEYVEIYNSGDASVNLNGWKLEDSSVVLYTLPSRTLQPGGYLLIAAGTNFFSSVSNKVGNTTNWSNLGGLGNGGDSVILRNSSNTIIAQLDYDDSDPWPVRADNGNSSLQILNREEIAADRYRQSNWIASREVDGSPGVAGLTTAGEVAINEILGNSGPAPDEIELHNLTDKEVDISGWVILKGDFSDNDVSGAIPNGTVIPPRGFVSFDENDLSNLRLSSTGEVLSLLNNTRTLFIDAVDFRPAEEGVSLGRLPNGTGDFFPGASPTFGQENVDHRLTPLVISEIMYHPLTESNASENRDLEFLEILNRSGSRTVNASTNQWRFRQDLDFDFPAFSLSPGERLLVVPFALSDSTKVNAFNLHYGVTLANLNVVGGYGVGLAGDNLSNRRAVIELREFVDIGASDGLNRWVTRDLVAYEDRDGWSPQADGLGASLDRIDMDSYGNDVNNWRGSYDYKGSPGTEGTLGQDVVINEVLAHSDNPLKDSIELYNTTSDAIDIGGWYLTDDFALLNRYQIPTGTILPGKQYIAFDSDDLGFSIDAIKGEDLWLTEVAGGSPVRFADNVSFGASFNPESFGRWPNGSGELFPMSARTLDASQVVYPGGANSGPIIADLNAPDTNSFSAKVIISEVMYNLGSIGGSEDQVGLDNFEYVELYNRTDTPISLGRRETGFIEDTPWVGTPQGWRLNTAVDYEFPCDEGDSACEIGPFGTVLVVGFDPAAEPAVLSAFRSRYGLDSSVKIFGPFEGDDVLNDSDDILELEAPELTPGNSTPESANTPNVLVDRVSYESAAPWPTEADGSGKSLTRIAPNLYGDFASSWTAATPSPGSVSGFDGPRVVDVIVSGSSWSAAFLSEISSPGAARQGYSFANASAQATPLPWALVDEISIVFDSNVSIQSRALSVRGINVADYAVGSNATYDAGELMATWEIDAGSISADRIIIDLDDGKVTDVLTSVHLDGEWTDGSGAASSGDGSPGGDFQFRLNIFGGDVDRDGDVGDDDFSDILGAMFSSVGDAAYSAETDTDGNGQVTVLDLVKARRRLDSSLPSGVANSPQAPASLRTAVISSNETFSGQSDDPAAVSRLARLGLRSTATRTTSTRTTGTAVRGFSALARRTSEGEIHQAVDRVYATSDDVLQSQRISRAALRHRFRAALPSRQGDRAESLSVDLDR